MACNVRLSINFYLRLDNARTGRPGLQVMLCSVSLVSVQNLPVDTLHLVTWVGINDVAMLAAFHQPIPPRLDAFFELQDKLYAQGARNFLFFGVPPMHRAPGGK
jgi:hypothetical protein